MRTWISTAGWRMTRACIRLILAGALLLPAGAGALAKEKGKGKPPDMEMLEFLGTFETSGGKVIDPLALPAQPRKGKTTAGSERKKGAGKKSERKKNGESDD